ncbi:unnamed protein product, partial [Ectocarpus sp. 13 AM-2016]
MLEGRIVIPTGLLSGRPDASASFSDHTWAVVLSICPLSDWISRTPLRLFPLQEVHCSAASLFVWISRTPSHEISAIGVYLTPVTIKYGRVRDLSAFSAAFSNPPLFCYLQNSPLALSDSPHFFRHGNLRGSLALFLAHALAPPLLSLRRQHSPLPTSTLRLSLKRIHFLFRRGALHYSSV